jgi:hypothetical protein
VTTTVSGASTVVGRSHAVNASMDSAAKTKIKYLMMFLLCVEKILSALLRAVNSLFRL